MGRGFGLPMVVAVEFPYLYLARLQPASSFDMTNIRNLP